MKALKQKQRASKQIHTKRAEERCVSLGSGGGQQEVGKGEPREGQQTKQLARLLPGKVGKEARRQKRLQRKPLLSPCRGEGW